MWPGIKGECPFHYHNRHQALMDAQWDRSIGDNLATLTELNEQSLLLNIRRRYKDNRIYTDVGDILVAVNPFCRLPVYDAAWCCAYNSPDVSELAPHIYRIAARAFNALVQGKKSQVCVISGESGAGKTESAKFIIHQVRVGVKQGTHLNKSYQINNK